MKKSILKIEIEDTLQGLGKAIRDLSERLIYHLKNKEIPLSIANVKIHPKMIDITLSDSEHITLQGRIAKIVNYLIYLSLWNQVNVPDDEFFVLRCWRKKELNTDDLYLVFPDWEENKPDEESDKKSLREISSRIRTTFEQKGLKTPIERETYEISFSIPPSCLGSQSQKINQSILETVKAHNLIQNQSYTEGIAKIRSALMLDSSNWEAHLLLCNVLGSISRDWANDIIKIFREPEIISGTIGCLKRYIKIRPATKDETLDSDIRAESILQKCLGNLYSEEFKDLWTFILAIKKGDLSEIAQQKAYEKFINSKAGRVFKQKAIAITLHLLGEEGGFISPTNIESYYIKEIMSSLCEVIAEKVELWQIRHGDFRKAISFLAKSAAYRTIEEIQKGDRKIKNE